MRARTESRLGFRVGGKMVSRGAEVGQRVERRRRCWRSSTPPDLRLGAGGRAGRGARGAGAATNWPPPSFRRYRELRDQGFISGAGARAPRGRAEGGRGAARAGARAGRRAGQPGRLRARWWRRRPGVVTAVEAEPGTVLAAGTPVLRLAHDGPRDAVFAVPEDRLAGDARAARQARRAAGAALGQHATTAAGHGARGGRRGRPGDAHLPGQGRPRRRRRCSWARRSPCWSSCRARDGVTKLPLTALMQQQGQHGGLAARPADDDGAARSRSQVAGADGNAVRRGRGPARRARRW
ncbi:MAG: hypothetical protein MZW92_45440 [Comamonadaceae bacterium]|nr:hypothetical protein [Comamonadaceae bacterium]